MAHALSADRKVLFLVAVAVVDDSGARKERLNVVTSSGKNSCYFAFLNNQIQKPF